jgi:hypothetical protein
MTTIITTPPRMKVRVGYAVDRPTNVCSACAKYDAEKRRCGPRFAMFPRPGVPISPSYITMPANGTCQYFREKTQ